MAKVILFSYKDDDINNFISKFYTSKVQIENTHSYQKNFKNPVEMSEFIAAFVDNINVFDITMWISLDEDVFIKISPQNANTVIKYLFERYPY